MPGNGNRCSWDSSTHRVGSESIAQHVLQSVLTATTQFGRKLHLDVKFYVIVG